MSIRIDGEGEQSMLRILMFVIGAIFAGASFALTKDAIFSQRRNVMESAIFGLLGMCVGVFLCVYAFTGDL